MRHGAMRGWLVAAVTGVGLVALAMGEPVVTQDAKAAKPAAAAAKPSVADLGFLSGVWQGSDGGSAWESWYSSPEGGQIVGASKELHDGRVVTSDFEHFYEREGQLRRTPFPFGKKSVEFTLAAHDAAARKAVFENPEHDFPSRFTYQRTDDTHLRIVLEGQPGVPPGTITLEFTRKN